MFLNEKNLVLSAKFSSDVFPFENYFCLRDKWARQTDTGQKAVSREQSAASFQALSYRFQSLPDFWEILLHE